MEAPQPQTERRTCVHCGTDNPLSARFCKRCGGRLRPPPECPACGAIPGENDKFCANCGADLLLPRPELAPVPIPVAAAEVPVSAAAALQAEARQLPAPRRPSSNILGNVMMFVAFLLVLVVVIYRMNKDAPKVISPFEGGPPPAAAASAPPRAQEGSAAPAGAAVVGRVVLGEGQSANGNLFVILRNPGATRGPPVAVRKIESPRFPQSFSVTSANTMFQGVPFTGPFDIQVRLDQDGNAMTKTAGDLVASKPVQGIKPGDDPVVITLDERL